MAETQNAKHDLLIADVWTRLVGTDVEVCLVSPVQTGAVRVLYRTVPSEEHHPEWKACKS